VVALLQYSVASELFVANDQWIRERETLWPEPASEWSPCCRIVAGAKGQYQATRNLI